MKNRRTIFEQQTVDLDTGEVKTVTTTSLRRNDESFVMGRTTAGFEWLVDLNALELKLLIIILDNKSRKDNTIPLTLGKVTDIATELRLSVKSIKNTIRDLRLKNLVKEISTGVYLVNPTTFYSGSSTTWKKQYEEYNSVPDKKYKGERF
jgi:hypothetical protein